jgi:hypothetical protein
MDVIESFDQVPEFENEADEATFWSTHRLGGPALEQLESLPEEFLPVRRTRPIAVRFDEDILHRLKALAKRKGKGYLTLLKEFVVERLYEEERRMGLIESDRPSGQPAAYDDPRSTSRNASP